MSQRASLFLAALVVALVAVLSAFDSALAHRAKALTARQERAIAREIRTFRDTVARTIEKKDASAIRALYADRFVHTHATGKVDDKEARIAAVLAGEPVIETAPVADVEIRAPAAWTAVATGESILRAGDGKTYVFRWTAIYVRGPSGWQIAASHATRLAESS
jgi:hypothetical protein